jgi:hypothetical protein
MKFRFVVHVTGLQLFGIEPERELVDALVDYISFLDLIKNFFYILHMGLWRLLSKMCFFFICLSFIAYHNFILSEFIQRYGYLRVADQCQTDLCFNVSEYICERCSLAIMIIILTIKDNNCILISMKIVLL